MAWTAPRTWVAGETVTAAIMNTHVRDNFKAIGDPWAAYAATITNLTVGTGGGSITAVSSVGKDTKVRLSFVIGTSGFSVGTPSVTLPFTPIASFGGGLRWVARDVSASTTFFGDADYNTSAVTFRGITSTAPMTWAAGDILGLTFEYEAQ